MACSMPGFPVPHHVPELALRFPELLCGFQNPDSPLPSVDEVDHGEPLAASAPAPQAKVRAPFRRGTTLVTVESY